MDQKTKTCHSSAESTASTDTTLSSTTTTTPATAGVANSRDQFLHHLNKISHKITKPISSSSPPVYNISKSDFRDVVQKLTGSPAHERISTATPPPTIHPAPKPPSSRLHRIRPPPLSQIANRPSPLLVGINPALASAGGNAFQGAFRPAAHLSPLPPLPTCHAAAESPISAYMRLLHSSSSAVDSDARKIPAFQLFTAMNPHMQNQSVMSQGHLSALTAVVSSSPLPFGCFPSPKWPCPILSPNLLFSPNVPAVPSPR